MSGFYFFIMLKLFYPQLRLYSVNQKEKLSKINKEVNMKRKLIENYTIENKEKLYRIAFSYTKNKEDALDIVQESVLKALKSANTLKTHSILKLGTIKY